MVTGRRLLDFTQPFFAILLALVKNLIGVGFRRTFFRCEEGQDFPIRQFR